MQSGERTRRICLIRVVALYEPARAALTRSKPRRVLSSGIVAEFSSINDAAVYISAKCRFTKVRPYRRYEVAIHFSGDDQAVGTFDDSTEAVQFLRRFAEETE